MQKYAEVKNFKKYEKKKKDFIYYFYLTKNVL